MTHSSHRSAEPSHYDEGAEYYDTFNEERSLKINHVIENILTQYNVETVLDLTCGTGSQVFWLTQHGFDVTGSDINASMLKIAKEKALKEGLDISLIKGDMRTLQAGQFDTVITIFNAIGHLTKRDFEKTVLNVYHNLKEKGLYIFDIFNLSYLLHGDNITKLTIDWHKHAENKMVREIQYSTISTEGTLTSFTTSILEENCGKHVKTESMQTLQVYSSQQLSELLEGNGFEVLSQTGINGSKLKENKTERILTVARKI